MENLVPTTKRARILCLDAGGAKGFYTLGILDELERNSGRPLSQSFDLIYGTSTGSIIAALIARGDSVASILESYRQHVPQIMSGLTPGARTGALQSLAQCVFGNLVAKDFKTRVGIVATNWKEHRAFIFKSHADMAHGSHGSFVPFFGCKVADGVVASCSASPFFNTHNITTSKGDPVELADGGFVANNPTLFAIVDATQPMGVDPQNLHIVSLGVGHYPEPARWKRARHFFEGWGVWKHAPTSKFLQTLLDTNTGAMAQLRELQYPGIPAVRVSETFNEPTLATDLLEHDLSKLNRLVQKGRESYRKNEVGLLAAINQ